MTNIKFSLCSLVYNNKKKLLKVLKTTDFQYCRLIYAAYNK